MGYVDQMVVAGTTYDIYGKNVGTIGTKNTLAKSDVTTALGYTPPQQDTTALTSMTGTLGIDHGGTGATTAENARSNLGLGSAATQSTASILSSLSSSNVVNALGYTPMSIEDYYSSAFENVSKSTSNTFYTSNLNYLGQGSNGYGDSVSGLTKVITISGASKLIIKVVYQTESTQYDWGCIWAGSYSNYTAASNYNNSISGKIGGNTKTTKYFTVDGDTCTIDFRSDSSQSNYYGMYAIVASLEQLSGGSLTSSDIVSALGYTPLSSVSYSNVTDALGFTPVSKSSAWSTRCSDFNVSSALNSSYCSSGSNMSLSIVGKVCYYKFWIKMAAAVGTYNAATILNSSFAWGGSMYPISNLPQPFFGGFIGGMATIDKGGMVVMTVNSNGSVNVNTRDVALVVNDVIWGYCFFFSDSYV